MNIEDETIQILADIGVPDAEMIQIIEDLVIIIRRYKDLKPAFRVRPVGAPYSQVRLDQQNEGRLEDAAVRLIARAKTKIAEIKKSSAK